MPFETLALHWLAERTGVPASQIQAIPLRGGISSPVFLIRSSRDLSAERFVLRVIDNREWLAEEPDLAEREAEALEYAQACGLRSPRLVGFALRDIGFGGPAVLTTFLEGKVDILPDNFATWLAGLADSLAAIHASPASSLTRRYTTWVEQSLLSPPAGSANPQIWRTAIDYWLRHHPAHDTDWPRCAVFLHRDYHPANILWQDGAVSGIVDWVNSCRGPAGIDVGHCRMNLAQTHGVAIAEEFLEHYQRAAPDFAYDPYWDIDTALDMCMPAPEFYAPWVYFGLEQIPQEIIQLRVEEYLQTVMGRV